MIEKSHLRFVSTRDTWTAHYGRCQRPVESFHSECLRTARTLACQSSKPIWVLFSGGIDSEVVAQSFFQAKVPFQVAIMRFAHDLNRHDIQWAIQACKKNNWPMTFFDLDIEKFWENDLLLYALPSRCVSPQLAATMWLMDQVEGFPVLGSGECLLTRSDGSSSDWALSEKEKVASWYRFLHIRKKSGCAGFFQHSPEIMLSALKDPLVTSWLLNSSHQDVSNSVIKHDFYSNYFALEKREKYTGFERLQKSDQYYRCLLKELMPNSDRVYKTDYFELINKLSYSPWRTFLNLS